MAEATRVDIDPAGKRTGMSGYRVKDRAAASFAGRSQANLVLAGCLLPAAGVVLAILDPRLRHWFLIPVTVCGVLISVDAIDWLWRRRDVFDPRAMLGLFGFHFYYLAPIGHVLLDHWPVLVSPAAGDWRSALGAMALLNAAGLVIYRAIVSLPDRGSRRASMLQLDPMRFHRLGTAAVMVGLAAFLAEVYLLGGPSGFLQAMTEDRAALAGLGWLLLLSESFPLLLFSLAAVRWRGVLRRRTGLVVPLLVGLLAVQLLVGGLRGSRSSLLWPLVLALILVHFLVRSISRRAFLALALAVFIVIYGYGLYKGAGVEVVDIAQGSRTVQEVSATTGRDLPTVLLGDLARADVQALLLDRVRASEGRWSDGSTYLAAPLSLVPRWLVAERPRDKVEVGTDLIYGQDWYAAGLRSGRVYGLTGEAIMNFGPVGGLLSFVVLGLFVRVAGRYCARARQGEGLAPKLLCPPLCAVTVILLTADLDNILGFLVGESLPLVLVVAAAMVGVPAASNVASQHARNRQ